ncbi:hypothetical protein JQK15_13535 [Sphingobium sp. BHU LFT2]|uniref:hypothetical protein n=1 Tax=Sphingobium sp. BHU LFT2 TaxID=2807634 RepID=UPI001BEC8BF0|nr:hypothetical protein [Sphingobium sp. BHU LFT2]MBT2244561.1 hypothetical protein [Sphingobium sp. BHU LFT2]
MDIATIFLIIALGCTVMAGYYHHSAKRRAKVLERLRREHEANIAKLVEKLNSPEDRPTLAAFLQIAEGRA